MSGRIGQCLGKAGDCESSAASQLIEGVLQQIAEALSDGVVEGVYIKAVSDGAVTSASLSI